MAKEFLIGFGILITYFLIFVSCLLILKKFVNMPSEYFRKSLHLVLLCSTFIFVYAFQTWWVSALAALLFIALAYPVLMLGEKIIKTYSILLTERKQGELKRSLITAFVMFTIVVAICWGWASDRLLVLACIFAWGFGDGAAALVGKQFGRNFLEGKLIEGRKSVEGTVAMFATSLVSVIAVLLIRGGLPWYGYIITSVLTAAACAFVELYTRNGHDTITCPLAATAVIIPCMMLWGGVLL